MISSLALGLGCFAACCFAAEPPAFVVECTRDDSPVGPLRRMAADGSVQVGTGPVIAGADVVSIRRQGMAPPHFPDGVPRVRLVNGDRIPGRLLSIAGDKLQFLGEIGAPQEISLPLSSLAAAWLTQSPVTPAETRALAEKRRQDVIHLTNGDTIEGTIVGWAANGPLRLDVEGRQVTMPRERVRSLMFNTELARSSKPRSVYRQIVLLDGARLSARMVELVGEELRATLLGGTAVGIPIRSVAAVNVFRGKTIYLSDLKPESYEHIPYLGVRWPLAFDHSVSGGDLRLGGGTYDKGIGMHSQSRVTYALPTGARRFDAVVGLDELTGRSGSVAIDVLADGKSLLSGPSQLAGTDPPRSLRLTLPAGSRRMTLVVDYGHGGDVQDQVDWADARVIADGAGKP